MSRDFLNPRIPLLTPHPILAASPALHIPQPCQTQLLGLGANKGPTAAGDRREMFFGSER